MHVVDNLILLFIGFFSLENSPNLTEVTVTLDRIVTSLDNVVIGLEANPNSDLVKFVDSCPRVELLRLNGKFLQLLAETPVPPTLSTLPESLKTLEFKGVKFMNFDEISTVVCLIRSAPNLQELYIEASTVELNQEQVSGYLRLMDCTTFPLRKLHLVKLTNILVFDPEFEFIRFILFSSPSLARMSIVQHPQLEVAEALEITKKLLLFRLASAVSIDFSSDSKT